MQLLQEDIKLTSTVTRIQANLTNLVDHNIHDEPHRANEESDTWKEVGRSRAMASRSKRYTRKCQMGTDSAPQLSNRYNLLCNYSEDDNSPINTLVSGIAKPRHAGKCKMNNKKRVMKKKQSKVMIFGDSHAKGCFLIDLFISPSVRSLHI